MNKLSSNKNTGGTQWPIRVAVLGVGLLGGSVAKALRRSNSEMELVAWARSDKKVADISSHEIFDQVTDSIQAAVDRCDVVVVASPVNHIAKIVKEANLYCSEDCLITDVGSTKYGIVQSIDQDPEARKRFVAAHPIAGSEKTGVGHSRADLFDQKRILLTPGQYVDPVWVQKAHVFWRLTGGITQEMMAKDHDTHLAAISHVPHLVSSLIAKVAPSDARALAGSGWNDITRVAAGDPAMWTAICQENRAAISEELERVRQEFDHLQMILDTTDDATLQAWLSEAQEIKNTTPKS